jgi:hypothetical protein
MELVALDERLGEQVVIDGARRRAGSAEAAAAKTSRHPAPKTLVAGRCSHTA